MTKGAKFFLLSSAGIAALAPAAPAYAQSEPPAANADAPRPAADDGQSGDIVVTAQRRSERLQDVPLSIAAFTAEQLESSGTRALEDLGDRTPNLYFKSLNVAMPNVAIRGIGSTQIDNSAEAPVGLFMDDVYIARLASGLSGFYDVERIEVLRGPQGTLYGRNTIGGAINVITRDPTRELEGELHLEYGSYDALRTRGAVGGPLTDTLSARFAFATNRRDGFTFNSVTDRRTNDENNVGARLKLLFEPTSAVRLELSAEFSRDDNADALPEIKGIFNLPLAPAQPEATPNEPYVGQSNVLGFQDRTIWTTSLRGDFDLSDSVSLTSITGYQHHDSNVLRDLDATALPVLQANDVEDGYQFSQELRLASTDESPFKWLIGLYYFRDDSDRREEWTLDGVFPNFAALAGRYFWVSSGGTESYAIFGQASYAFSEQFELVLGLRYSNDQKEMDFLVGTTAAAALPSFVSPTAGFTTRISDSWNSLDPAITVNFRPAEDFLIYASYKTGFKSGGFQNRPSTQAIASIPYEPEDLEAWEAGIRTEWFGRRLVANMSAFHYDYRNLQQLVLAPNSALTITDNVGRARVRGAEVEITARPLRGLDLNLGYAYLDATFRDYVDPSGTQRAGNRLARAPEHSFNLSAQYTARIDPGRLEFRLEHVWHSETFFTADNAPVNREGPVGLLNGRIAFTTRDDRLTLALTGSNLTKEVYCANQATSIPSLSAARCWVGAPRQFAVSARYRF